MALTLNLEKSKNALILNLQKAGILTPPVLDVGFAMDVSASFEDEHVSGVTDRLLTRLVPWGLAFDPDGKLDVMTYSDGPDNVQDVGPVDASNYVGFVQRKIIGVKGYNGGTGYSWVLARFLQLFGWTSTVKKAGFFGRLLGQKDELVKGAQKRSLVVMATDGDNNERGDEARTRQVLQESEARGDKVFFLFLGISNQGSSFPFLEKLNKEFSNAAFVGIENLREFIELSDDELNEKLLGSKLLKWFADGQ